MIDLSWFNWGSPWIRIKGLNMRLWNLFNRRSVDGHFWGVGLGQVGNRHLFYIGHSGKSILFCGKTL